jgi:hypothetical protein
MKSPAPNNRFSYLRTILILALILICAALRLAPHPRNFTPIGAMAIFAGAMVRNRPFAFLFPIVAMFATDLISGFNTLSPLVYASFALSVLFSRAIVGPRFNLDVSTVTSRPEHAQHPTPRWPAIPRVAAATFLGSLQFFIVTNFGVWAFLDSYPRTAIGLASCYLAGLPLFLNTLAGDITYTALLFGAFALASVVVGFRFSVSQRA